MSDLSSNSDAVVETSSSLVVDLLPMISVICEITNSLSTVQQSIDDSQPTLHETQDLSPQMQSESSIVTHSDILDLSPQIVLEFPEYR